MEHKISNHTFIVWASGGTTGGTPVLAQPCILPMKNLEEIKQQLYAEREALKVYLLTKFHGGDYHGVQDAASDLRDIEAKLEIIKFYEVGE